jgi:HK97 family phage portal protein
MISKIKRLFDRKQYGFETVSMGGGCAVWNEWSTEKGLKEGYYANAWVYACANIRANSIAAAQWIIEEWRGGEWVENKDSSVYQVIERPNPRMSWAELLKLSMLHRDMGGNSYWLKVRAGVRVVELWPLMPDKVQLIVKDGMYLTGYKYNNKTIAIDDIIHLKHINPANINSGAPILKSIARTIDTDRQAEEWQKVSMQNRGVPDGMLQIDGHIDPEQRQKLVEDMRKSWTGAKSARLPFVGSANLTWVPFAQTPSELDFINSRQYNREGICAAFSVPMPMVGDYNKATLANIETARKIFWLDTMSPLLELTESELNNQFIQMEYGPNVRLRFDLTNIDALQENRQDKIEAAKGLWSMGVPFNQINTHLEIGLDAIEGGDISYIQSGLLPANLLGMDFEPVEGDAKMLKELCYGRN